MGKKNKPGRKVMNIFLSSLISLLVLNISLDLSEKLNYPLEKLIKKDCKSKHVNKNYLTEDQPITYSIYKESDNPDTENYIAFPVQYIPEYANKPIIENSSKNINNNSLRSLSDVNLIIQFFLIFFSVWAAFLLSEWSRLRRKRKVEKVILNEIYNGLCSDIEDLNRGIKIIEASQEGVSYIQYAALNPYSTEILNTSFLKTIKVDIFKPNKSGYESLKSSSLLHVSNDALRFKIINLYESTYKIIESEFYENIYQRVQEQLTDFIFGRPFLFFDKKGKRTGLKRWLPIDEKNTQLLLNILLQREMSLSIKKRNYRYCIFEVEKIKSELGKYLKRE